jgi:hypothetical protein
MILRCKQTFDETLREVAPWNAQVLELKAHTAATLARICPECQSILQRIETQALDQAFRIFESLTNDQGAPHAGEKRVHLNTACRARLVVD